MPPPTRFDAPRSLARALAELARRAGGAHAREAELRAALPSALGAWLHARLADVRLEGDACTLVMGDATGAREVEALAGEIAQELRRRMGAAAPGFVRVARGPARPPRHARREPARPASERPLVAQALAGVADPDLRRRLARWAGVSIDPARKPEPP